MIGIQKKLSDCEIEIKKIDKDVKLRISRGCSKEQIEALNLKKFADSNPKENSNEAKTI